MKKRFGSVIAMALSAALCFASVFSAQAAESGGDGAAGETITGETINAETESPEVAPVIEKVETEQAAKEAARGSVSGDSKVTWTNNTMPACFDITTSNLWRRAFLTSVEDGYMRVAYDGKSVVIEYYDEDFHMVRQGKLSMELDVWGGFYKGEDAYYIAEGQLNKDDIDGTEVVRIIKYDFDWNRLGAGNILAQEGWEYEIRYPFDYSCINMEEVDGKLYLITGREGYVDEQYGMGHQGMMLIRMDEETFDTEIVYGDFWHSFAQYLVHDGTDLYIGELSEGSGCTMLSRFDTARAGTDYFDVFSDRFPVLEYGGSRTSAWAIAVYASVDDLTLSSDNILCLGTSIDQSQYDNVTPEMAHNIYLTVTPLSDPGTENTTVKWLTDYSGDGKCFIGTNITKVNDDRFLVTWEELPEDPDSITLADKQDTLSCGMLHYVFVDGSGNKISEEYTAPAMFSECHPILKDGRVVYYSSSDNCLDFYTIDAQSGDFSKSVTRIAGNNVSWDYKDGVLSLSGEGAIKAVTNGFYRDAVSSTNGGYTYSNADNCWKYLRGNVSKINIGKGITSIPEMGFAYFYKAESIILPQGLKSIGKLAFCGTPVEELTIPASVSKIGEDILWTGSLYADEQHVVYATIIGNCGSYAIEYAKSNDIYYKEKHSWVSGVTKATTTKNGKTYKKCKSCGEVTSVKVIYYPKTITLSKTTFACTGKEQKPQVTVKGSNGKVITADHYTVVYSKGCKVPGTYYAKVVFKGNYEGSAIRRFKIVPKTTTIKKLTPKSRSLTVEWVKQPLQTTGYQIQYSTDSGFKTDKKTVTVKGASKVSRTLTGLKGGKKYYVHVRTYKVVGSTTYYSPWGAVKAATVKK